MTKNEFISRYGEEAYKKRLERSKEWSRKNGTPTTKAEFIAKYGEEAYENRKKYAREYHSKNDRIRRITKKEGMIARYGEEWYEEHKKYSKELNRKSREKEDIEHREERLRKSREYGKNHHKVYISVPINKLNEIIRSKKNNAIRAGKNIDNYIVSPDEAELLLKKEADECGIPEILNMDFMMDRFYNNCKYSLVYGNLEILKYFYRLMQIKAAKNEDFTENDKILLHYFRNCKIGKINSYVLQLTNDWLIDVSNIDMAYVEDMVRNVKGNDLMLTEEKYLEMKGLTDQE